MKKLLYLVHRLPFPPNKGDKIASFNLLKFLATRYAIYLGCFIDDPVDWQYTEEMKQYCTDSCIVNLNPKLAKLKCLQGLVTGEPLSLPYYKNATLQHWVDTTLEQHQMDGILIFSGVMAQYVSPHIPLKNAHAVLDLVDVDSDKWRLYAKDHRWPLSWLYQREADQLLAYETAMTQRFDATVFVSEQEAHFFKQLAPEVADKVVFRVHGVDSQFFDPALQYDSPYPQHSKTFVFAGAMDYWPNVHAAIWFAEEIFPQIKQQVAEACFYIVGMNPTHDVVKLAEIENVVVTGSVPDIRPYIAHATVVVAPLRIARGIQNKVLEAMAMAKPLLATQNALNGIREYPGFTPDIAETAEDMIQLGIQLIQHPEQQNGTQARHCVLEHYNWDTNLKRIEQLLAEGLST